MRTVKPHERLNSCIDPFKNKSWQTTQCVQTKNAHRQTIAGGSVAPPQNRFRLTKYLNPTKTMKKVSSVPFSNPIQNGEKFTRQTFIRLSKAKGMTESEAENKFQAFLNSGEIQEWEERTENLFERTVKIYFRGKC